jgi:hypothetical protein
MSILPIGKRLSLCIVKRAGTAPAFRITSAKIGGQQDNNVKSLKMVTEIVIMMIQKATLNVIHLTPLGQTISANN